MEKQVEKFLENILGVSSNDDTLVTLEFRDGSVVEFDINSLKFKTFTAPMTTKNIVKEGTF